MHHVLMINYHLVELLYTCFLISAPIFRQGLYRITWVSRIQGMNEMETAEGEDSVEEEARQHPPPRPDGEDGEGCGGCEELDQVKAETEVNREEYEGLKRMFENLEAELDRSYQYH